MINEEKSRQMKHQIQILRKIETSRVDQLKSKLSTYGWHKPHLEIETCGNPNQTPYSIVTKD